MSKAQEIVDQIPARSRLAVLRLLAKEYAEKQLEKHSKLEEGQWVQVSTKTSGKLIGQVQHILPFGIEILLPDKTLVTVSLSCMFTPTDPPEEEEESEILPEPQAFLEGLWRPVETVSIGKRTVTCSYEGRIVTVLKSNFKEEQKQSKQEDKS